MSISRPNGRELLPVGWVKAPASDALQFVHRDTGLHLEAEETEALPPGVDCSTAWTMNCGKSVGETEKKVCIDYASTEESVRRTLHDWMSEITRMSEQGTWDETVALGTVADELKCDDITLDGPYSQDGRW